MADRWFDGTFYKRAITLNYMDCNVEKKAFLHYILGIFSEIAGDESQAKGNTHEELQNTGLVFLITRMSVRFHRTPQVNDTLIFTTWFRGAEGRFFFRDCEVHSPEGELILSLSGTWALIDLIEHKVLDAQRHPNAKRLGDSRTADCPECKKIVPDAPMATLGYRPVYYSDLDCNYHLNNTAYSKIATDFLPPKLQDRAVRDFVINFNKETKLGETLELRGGGDENSYIVQGYCGGVLHYGCEFIFQ